MIIAILKPCKNMYSIKKLPEAKKKSYIFKSIISNNVTKAYAVCLNRKFYVGLTYSDHPVTGRCSVVTLIF